MPTSSRSRLRPDCPAQDREAVLRGAQDPRASGRRLDGDVRVPAKSTIHAVSRPSRSGQTRRRAAPPRARHAAVRGRHAQWVRRLQGCFKLGNGRYCYPLTVTDHASRFLLLCEALDSTREDPAFAAGSTSLPIHTVSLYRALSQREEPFLNTPSSEAGLRPSGCCRKGDPRHRRTSRCR
jgi:hypothetical protein